MGFENFVKEAGKGKGLKVQPWMRGYMTYILPVIVMAFILLGLFYKGNREQAPTVGACSF